MIFMTETGKIQSELFIANRGNNFFLRGRKEEKKKQLKFLTSHLYL